MMCETRMQSFYQEVEDLAPRRVYIYLLHPCNAGFPHKS